jgi:asparagine synthetase B (glutamine-hydrolysing)
MCGFAGIAGRLSDLTVPIDRMVAAMTGTLLHRGPDSDGSIVAPFAHVGFRRLSISHANGISLATLDCQMDENVRCQLPR